MAESSDKGIMPAILGINSEGQTQDQWDVSGHQVVASVQPGCSCG